MNGADDLGRMPRRGSLDIARLVETGGLFRFITRNSQAPVRAFDRASWFVFGMIAGVSLVGVGVFAAGWVR